MILSNEDIALIDKLHDIAVRGWYADSMQVTNLYNKVLERHEPNTNCGSCIRRRVMELWAAKEAILKQLEKEQKEEGQSDVQPTEDKAQEEAGKPKKEKTVRRNGKQSK